MNRSRKFLPQIDLERVDERLARLWPDLQDAHLLLTGGTGFYGHWLLEPLLWSATRRNIKLQVDVLSRQPALFQRRSPHLAFHPVVTLLDGNVKTFRPSARYTHVIHAATEASAALEKDRPREMFNTAIDGTRAALEAARPGQARFLLTSSGAVYGAQPHEMTHISEDHPGGPLPFSTQATYAEGKRAAETMCAIAAQDWGIPVVSARGFAFVGPHLPLDRHFAIGNFLADALAGRPIRVAGDGTPYRSYMYAADLAVWLWTMLLKGTPGQAYNVGSEVGITIRQVAELVAEIAGLPVEINKITTPSQLRSRYVPSTRLAQDTLALKQEVDLRSAIQRTLAWHTPLSPES